MTRSLNKFSRIVLASTTSLALVLGAAPAATAAPGLEKQVAQGGQLPPGLQKLVDRGHLPPRLAAFLTSSAPGGSSTVTPAPEQQPTELGEQSEADLSDVVPDADFRRYLNTEHLGRAATPNAPISAEDMKSVRVIADPVEATAADGTVRTVWTALYVPNEAGEDYISCGPMCGGPATRPNLEGIQFAENLEVLAVRYVTGWPEPISYPKLHTLDLDFDGVSEIRGLNGEKFPALEDLTISGNTTPVFTDDFASLTTLKKFAFRSHGATELPQGIGELPALEELWVDAPNVTALPESLLQVDTLRTVNAPTVRTDDPVAAQLAARGVDVRVGL